MSKFCGNCGTELQDDAVVCSNCGVNLAPKAEEAAPAADTTPADVAVAAVKKGATVFIDKCKSDKKFLGIVLGAVAGVVALIVVLCLIFGGGYEKAIDRYVDANYYGDYDACLELIPDDMLDKMLDSMDITKKEFKEQFKEEWEDKKDRLEDEFGKDIKVSYKVTDEDKIDKDDLDEIKDGLKEMGISKKSITEGYEIEVEFTIEGDDDEDTEEETFNALKIDGEWYIF